jgi:hypothetical protein
LLLVLVLVLVLLLLLLLQSARPSVLLRACGQTAAAA